MKSQLSVLAIVFLFLSPLALELGLPADVPAPVSTLEAPGEDPLDVTTGWTLPSCWSIRGTSCTSGYARCMWQAGEPDICICIDGTFHCSA